MAGKVVEVETLIGRDRLAAELSNRFFEWNSSRETWMVEKEELRDYIFATDTRKTTNNKLPWKNSTTIPKLCQIRDNLIANYIPALFPNDDWMRWEAYTEDSNEKRKKDAIVAYLSNKLRESGFYEEVSKLVDDYVTYGNCFAELEYVNETNMDPDTGEEIQLYVGPRVRRISPYDIVFNPLAPTFAESPQFTRSIKTIGELKMELDKYPERPYNKDIIEKMMHVRHEISNFNHDDVHKAAGFMVDGFGSLHEYYQSEYVEILRYEGDVHDNYSGELLQNQEVIIVDRSYIIYQAPIKNWTARSSRVHCGWRDRPDNLYGMGPLDNLVGMQYRIDHLENLKADVFDFIAHPIITIRGNVEEFNYEPGGEIFLGDDGDVQFLRPDATALNADTQIAILEAKMEEMAGAPRQALGIRTPGEKTAFEVQSLDNAASRIFQHKTIKFEKSVIEPLLNMFLESARRNLNGKDLIRVMDDDLGVIDFLEITKDDLTAKGKIRPIGARHFAARAQKLQNLVGIFSSPLRDIVLPHTSGKSMMAIIEDLLDVGRHELFKENIALVEAAETQKMMQQLQDEVDINAITPTEDPEELELEEQI